MRLPLYILLLLIFLPLTAHADGSLPPQPYRYLHPPPSLARNNLKPLAGQRVLPVDYLKQAHWYMFTTDGQTGIAGPPGAFAVSSGAQGVLITVSPAETPSGLPPQLEVDGNAYQMQAVEQPSNKPVNLAKAVTMTMRWPRIPEAMYLFDGNTWKRLCAIDTATLTPTTIACPSRALGIVAAVRIRTGPLPSPTPSTNTGQRLTRYISAGAAILVIVAAAVIAFVLTRRPRV